MVPGRSREAASRAAESVQAQAPAGRSSKCVLLRCECMIIHISLLYYCMIIYALTLR